MLCQDNFKFVYHQPCILVMERERNILLLVIILELLNYLVPLTHFMTTQNSLGSHKTKPFSIPLNQSFLSINIRTFSKKKRKKKHTNDKKL